MSYSQGTLIEATDYFSLAAAGAPYTGPNIGQHWGPGTGAHGMGQNLSAIQTPTNAVVPGMVITAVQWSGLLQTINNCLRHQGHSIITPNSVVAGTKASYYSSILIGSALSYSSAGVTGLSLNDSSANTSTFNGTWGQTGNKTLETTHTVAFASADHARYFFNAGGKLKLAFSRTGGSATAINSDWSILCSHAGSIQIGYKNTTKVGGSGSITIANANNGGYWNLNTAYTNQVRQFSNGGGGYYGGYGGYGSGIIKVDVAVSGTSSNGGYPTVLIRTIMDNSSSPAAINGNTAVSLVVSHPATTYISNTWGTPVITANSIAI